VSDDILLVNYSWQFYALKHRGRFEDAHAVLRRPVRLRHGAGGSLFLSRPDSDRAGALDASGLTRVATIDNVDGHPAFAVYEK
jgi:hypothetical protein